MTVFTVIDTILTVFIVCMIAAFCGGLLSGRIKSTWFACGWGIAALVLAMIVIMLEL